MATGNKTIVLISPGFPADEADTTCLPVIQTFVRTLNKQYPDIKVKIIAYQYPHYRSSYIWHGNEVISEYARKGKLIKLFEWLRLWKLLIRINKQTPITGILNFWYGEYVLPARCFAVFHGIKNYIWLQGQDARPGNKFVNLLKPRAQSIIALSDALSEEFYKNYRITPAHIIPFGPNIELQSSPATERTIDVLGVGSLIPLKQYEIFIDVINELRKTIPGIKTVIYGKGVEEKSLRNKVVFLSLQNNISIAGEAPHQKIIEEMQRTKILLHPSSYEGQSSVCFEALYAGAHVVSFTRAMKENIEQWHIVKDKQEMTEQVRQLLSAKQIIYESILPYDMKSAVAGIMDLFTN